MEPHDRPGSRMGTGSLGASATLGTSRRAADSNGASLSWQLEEVLSAEDTDIFARHHRWNFNSDMTDIPRDVQIQSLSHSFTHRACAYLLLTNTSIPEPLDADMSSS